MSIDKAELIRKKYKYRRLILEGKLVLPHEDAVKLLGPDCAYHLYSVEDAKQKPRTTARRHRRAKT